MKYNVIVEGQSLVAFIIYVKVLTDKENVPRWVEYGDGCYFGLDF